MDNNPFKPKSRKEPPILFRLGEQRATLRSSQNYVTFKSPNDSFEAFINVQVLKFLRQQLKEAYPNETIGLLSGRPIQDELGYYTIVEQAIAAERGDLDRSTPGFVRISAEGHSNVQKRLITKAPAHEVIGWYHTHPDFVAQYSGEDKQEQSTWPYSYHLGVVISGRNDGEPFGVYQGPQSIRLLSVGNQLDKVTSGGTEAQEKRKIPDVEQKFKPVGHSQVNDSNKTTHSESSRVKESQQDNRIPLDSFILGTVTLFSLLIIFGGIVAFLQIQENLEQISDIQAEVSSNLTTFSATFSAPPARLQPFAQYNCTMGEEFLVPVEVLNGVTDPLIDILVRDSEIVEAQYNQNDIIVNCLSVGTTDLVVSMVAGSSYSTMELPIQVLYSDISVAASLDQDTATIGDQLVFTVETINLGPNDAQEIIVDIDQLDFFDLASYEVTNGELDRDRSEWVINYLPVGSSEELRLILIVPSDYVEDSEYLSVDVTVGASVATTPDFVSATNTVVEFNYVTPTPTEPTEEATQEVTPEPVSEITPEVAIEETE